MKIITSLEQWRKIRKSFSDKQTLGFVPTMGCLHQGHAALINNSVAKNDITILSIFVNPTQFNDPADYQHYPKTVDQDLELAHQLKVDYVLLPEIEEMYSGGNTIYLETNHSLATMMEGEYRPGHFNGVLTIVMKLLMLVRPHQVYFGEKDYQQCCLIQSLIQQYFIQTEIIFCSTVRLPCGLPFSSRNKRLTDQEWELLGSLYQFLFSSPIFNLDRIKEKITELNLHCEYLIMHDLRLFLALKMNATRIIDNLLEGGSYVN